MRDLSTEELGHVYGAGGKSRKSCKPAKYKCKGGSSSGSRHKSKCKGGSS